MKTSPFLTLLLAAALAAPLAHAAVVIDYVPIGNPGNAPDQTYTSNGGSFAAGAVSYNYAIGTYEVTNSQYNEFLNTVDPTGANLLSLYDPSMATDAQAGITYNSGAANGAKFEIPNAHADGSGMAETWRSWKPLTTTSAAANPPPWVNVMSCWFVASATKVPIANWPTPPAVEVGLYSSETAFPAVAVVRLLTGNVDWLLHHSN